MEKQCSVDVGDERPWPFLSKMSQFVEVNKYLDFKQIIRDVLYFRYVLPIL